MTNHDRHAYDDRRVDGVYGARDARGVHGDHDVRDVLGARDVDCDARGARDDAHGDRDGARGDRDGVRDAPCCESDGYDGDDGGRARCPPRHASAATKPCSHDASHGCGG